MDSPARLLLVLALTVSCTVAQLDSPRTQSISGGISSRSNRNPSSTTTTTTTSSPSSISVQTTLVAPITSSASQLITTLAPEQPKQQSQILTPLRNRTTSTLLPSTSTATTTTTTSTTQSTTTSSNSDDAITVDPEFEDLCIVSLDKDAYKVNTVWSPDNCKKRCRCVFKSEPRDSDDERIWETENWKTNSLQTEIRCSLPEQCVPDDYKLPMPSRKCPAPIKTFPPTDNFESCDCPTISCGLPPAPSAELIERPLLLTPQKLFPSSMTPTVAPPTISLATTTTTTQPPQTTTTTTTTTTTVSPPATTNTPSLATVPATTRLIPTKLVASHSQPPTTTATITTNTNARAATTTSMTTPLADATSTIASSSSEQNRPTATGEPRVSPSSIIQAMEAPLERYAAHLLIALAIMTSLFVVMSFMYLRRAFRSSMVPITDCYENPAFTKRVLLIDETDQNFRNKNKEVDGFSPRLLI